MVWSVDYIKCLFHQHQSLVPVTYLPRYRHTNLMLTQPYDRSLFTWYVTSGLSDSDCPPPKPPLRAWPMVCPTADPTATPAAVVAIWANIPGCLGAAGAPTAEAGACIGTGAWEGGGAALAMGGGDGGGDRLWRERLFRGSVQLQPTTATHLHLLTQF